MIDRYELTAKLSRIFLEALRESPPMFPIEDVIDDALIIAKTQYDRKFSKAKREEENLSKNRDTMKQVLLSTMKALRSLSNDENTQKVSDEELENMFTNDILDFASKLSEPITNISNDMFKFGASLVQEKKNDNTTTHISSSNTDSDFDDFIIGEWLKHREW